MPSKPARRYQSLAQDLTLRIKQGEWLATERLPSLRELCLSYAVSMATAKRALETLLDLGLVQVRAQAGFFVAAKPAEEKAKAQGPDLQQLHHQRERMLSLMQLAEQPLQVSLLMYGPDG